MLVGIIDCDLFVNRKTFLPNPEVMLLSSYHKKKGDIVHLLLDGKTIDIYEKIYICRNKTQKFKFPDELYSRKNVTCRGLYFTNGITAPIEEEIMSCAPDKSIYDKYCKYWGDKPINGVKTFLNTQYISIKGEIPWVSKKYATYIYDQGIGNQESYDKILAAHQEDTIRTVHFYYPIICATIDDAVMWATAPFITGHPKILYPSTVTHQDLGALSKKKLKHDIEAYITNKTRFNSQKELEEVIISALDLALYTIINDIPIKFKLNPKIKITEQFRLLKRLSDWTCSTVQPSFYDFCTLEDKLRIELLIKDHPELKDWFFMKPHEFRKNGGVWVYGRRASFKRYAN